MQKFLARENIKRFRALLEVEQNETRRHTLRELIKAEEHRLHEFLNQQTERMVD